MSDSEPADIQALENFQASAVTRNSNAGYRLPGQAKAIGALWAASQAAFQLDSSDHSNLMKKIEHCSVMTGFQCVLLIILK